MGDSKVEKREEFSFLQPNVPRPSAKLPRFFFVPFPSVRETVPFFRSHLSCRFWLQEEGISDDYGRLRTYGVAIRWREYTRFVNATNVKEPFAVCPTEPALRDCETARCWFPSSKKTPDVEKTSRTSFFPKSVCFSTPSSRPSPLPTLHPTH